MLYPLESSCIFEFLSCIFLISRWHNYSSYYSCFQPIYCSLLLIALTDACPFCTKYIVLDNSHCCFLQFYNNKSWMLISFHTNLMVNYLILLSVSREIWVEDTRQSGAWKQFDFICGKRKVLHHSRKWKLSFSWILLSFNEALKMYIKGQ